ncbi:MAG TPA: hypothetical protein VGR90_05940, partial [Acidimicrobiales bacterium]|nr:hypothetical protein [Acidimicrobiales bacterium]
AFLAGSPAGWQHRSLPCAQPTQAVAASSGTNMAAVCSGGGAAGSESKQLYVSSDAGATWRGTTAAPLGGDTFGVTSASPSVDVISAASGASELYATFDGGGTWSTVFQDTTGRPWRDLGFTTPNQGVVVEGVVPPMSGAGNQLLMTRDGGHSWAVVAF